MPGLMKSFFPMPADEAKALMVLVVFAAGSFLPMWRNIEVAGMALFGWLMAGLMILSPALALFVFLRKS